MFVVTVTFQIHSAHLQDFHQAITTQARNSLELEPGCLQFDVCFSDDEPDCCFLYEIYTDKAAFDDHLNSEHFIAFNRRVESWTKRKVVRYFERVWPEVQSYSDLSG